MVVKCRSLIVSLVYGFRFARSVRLPLSVYHPCVAYTWNPTVSRDQHQCHFHVSKLIQTFKTD